MRKDKDSLGTVSIPDGALYSSNTVRGAENFRLIGRATSAYPNFVIAMAKVKKAAAQANKRAGALPPDLADAINSACDEIIAGQHHDNFIVALAEGSGGTSINMNFNEVIANRAGQILGDPLGSFKRINPNDHINLSQSTNDVIPTAVKLACVTGAVPLIDAAGDLVQAFRAKADEYRDVLRLGRTCMQAAQPMSYGQLFNGYAATLERAISHLNEARCGLQAVPMGGTAIGTGLGAAAGYHDHIAATLSEEFATGITLPDDYFDAMQAADGFSRFSGELKILSETIGKIAADLVILGSGGNSGIGEIILPSVQPGSSIMAGKVNPVICMMVQQVAFMVQGHDATVSIAALSGQMEINHFEPVMAHSLFNAMDLLINGCTIFRSKCIEGLRVDENRSYANLASSFAISTVLLHKLGYVRVSELAKSSVVKGISLADNIVLEGLMTEDDVRQALADATTGAAS
ncbi:lyase family protein [Candidatus Halocynthiibacter alkanivorans]|uniref:lyase family protein n=1 Tax=Candidatus Halocynthiibacter alkanivorans TaxID=2267619 RepID=UPI000DF4A90E|nr:lyase family protein [Candidatus Halocynthiibacter alkanivorans]